MEKCFQNAAYVDNSAAINNPLYTDKASERRKTVGSDSPEIVRHKAPASVHRYCKDILVFIAIHLSSSFLKKGRGWPGGRASDSKPRGPWFDPHSGHRFVFLKE